MKTAREDARRARLCETAETMTNHCMLNRRPLTVLLLAGLLVALLAGCGGSNEDGLATPVPTKTDPESLRETPLGAVIGGKTQDGAFAWRGIPFAAPPVGELRWRAPKPPAPWEGTREALAHPPSCVQYQGFDPKNPPLVGQEDCLYLNVFTPALAPNKVPTGNARLPVLVWIHGGGNSVGDAMPYDGGILARDYNVVVVAVQYRLGPLGWLHHPALAVNATPEDASGNYGTLDLIASLRWVKQNISAFGGNPDNVTVFGESAGGRNVFSLMLSPLASGLFHRAIAQSGSAGLTLTVDAQQGDDRGGPENTGNRIVERLVPEAPADDLPAVAKAMRATPPKAVFEAVTGDRMMGMVRSPPGLCRRRGAAQGYGTRGFPKRKLPTRFHSLPEPTATKPSSFQLGDEKLVRWWFGVPVGLRDAETYNRNALYGTQFWKLRAVDEPADRMRETQGPSVFAYRFDWDEEPKILWVDFSQLLGAAHALEIPFVFGSYDLGPLTPAVFNEDNAPGREELGRRMRSYWIEFARTGDPGRGVDGDLPAWTAYESGDANAPRLMMLDTEQDGGVRMKRPSAQRAGRAGGPSLPTRAFRALPTAAPFSRRSGPRREA